MATDRRQLLKSLAIAPFVLPRGYSQTTATTARATLSSMRHKGDMDRRVLGAFLEHLGRAVYEGVYDPKSPLADAKGFRKDVLAEIKAMRVPIMRYPGGNFVSGYNWLDGVGPRSQRPTVLERAWNSLETNQFGTNDFIEWARAVGTEPLLGGNFGTGTVAEQVAYVEYCNVDRGTKWSDLRRSHGYEQPHNVKYWCLGNEMDGPWQIGAMTSRDYGRKARDAAKQFRVIDPTLKLIACGSSGPGMPQYMSWDREVLEECYDMVDGISLHAYYGNTQQLTGKKVGRYLAMNLDMERQIHEVSAVCDYVQGLNRSSKRLWLSFDEWNVWYRARGGDYADGKRKYAPHLLEEVYNLEDALLVGGFVNTLLRRSDRVRVGCIAQIVNVIAPLMTNAEKTIRQTIYYPYAWGLEYAHGRVLDLHVACDTYAISGAGLSREFARNEQVPFIDIVATLDAPSSRAALFILNRDTTGEREITVNCEGFTPTRVLAAKTLTGKDLTATNTFEAPNNVVPVDLPAPRPGASMTLRVPAGSYSVIHLAT
jgi:alpha-L-arabinofuranosidase